MSNFSPTPGSTVQRPDIAKTLAGFKLAMEVGRFVGTRILPIEEVSEAFGNYGRLEATEIAQDVATERAAGGGYSRTDFKITQDNYATVEQGIEVKLDANFMQAYKYLTGGDADKYRMLAAQIAQNIIMLNQEKRIAAKVFDPTVWTGSALNTSVSTEWSTVSSATPIADTFDAKQKVRAVFGEEPDTLICSTKVRDNLRRNAEILAKISAVRDVRQSQITDSDIAGALGLSQLIAGDSMRPTHIQGAATPAFTDVWDDEYAMICKLAMPMADGGITNPGLGRTFHWREDGSIPSGMVETYWNDELRCEVVRVRHQTGEKIEIVYAGHLLDNITA